MLQELDSQETVMYTKCFDRSHLHDIDIPVTVRIDISLRFSAQGPDQPEMVTHLNGKTTHI